MRILLSGGGTGGSVSPVLAVALEIRKLKPKVQFLWIGTRFGPERQMIESVGIRFMSIPAAKFRRYFSWQNFSDPFVFLAGLVKALVVVLKFRPQVTFSVGAFVSVPVAWAGKLAGSKVVILQQDARIGLANKLIAPFAAEITTAFNQTSKDFYSGSGLFKKSWKRDVVWVGNPVRQELLGKHPDRLKFFPLTSELPILLVLGGALGARQINELLQEALPKLVTGYQVVHQTGKDKNFIDFRDKNYHPYEFIPYPEYAAILNAAHMVVARAGMSTIAELSALGKIAIIIPIPGTHQEDNARILAESGAAVVLDGNEITAEDLITELNRLKFDPHWQEKLATNITQIMPKAAAYKLAQIIIHQAL